LLRRLSRRRREPPLERRGLEEIAADPVHRRLPAVERVGLDPLRHIAHQPGQRRQIVLNSKELEGPFTVPLADGRLLVAERADLAEGVRARRGDGDERQSHTYGERSRRGTSAIFHCAFSLLHSGREYSSLAPPRRKRKPIPAHPA
jgi:hypothetical protein